MKILITGICGFMGSRLARWFRERQPAVSVSGVDNFLRAGSETNRLALEELGVRVTHADLRVASDSEALGAADWVIEAAAVPSVLAGIDGQTNTRQLIEHNLQSTINMLEYCRARKAGFILLSTSRVYSIPALREIPLADHGERLEIDASRPLPPGVSPRGLSETFSTRAPVSLYGGTKLASECLALEYGATFELPVWINRCGVLAGAGQFGRADQGIFSYWIHAYRSGRPLRYIGFGGRGVQVRDVLHPEDLAGLVWQQMQAPAARAGEIFNVAGGPERSMSLRELSAWCARRFGERDVQADPAPRTFDVPWVIMDSARVSQAFGWKPARSLEDILGEIADHAEKNPDWLKKVG